VGTLVLLLGLAVLAAAFVLFSPWLAAVASLLTVAGLILGLAGPAGRRQWLPVWAVLWLLIPPPMALDQNAVTRLQHYASRASSLTLDVFGIGHVMEGNVLVLPAHRLLVEEACSGINSLFTLLAVTALFVVATRRPLVWSGLLLVSSVGWAGLTNAARVVMVAVGQASYGRDLSTGWPHTALGLATVALGLLMVICTDRLLAFLLGPILPAEPGHELNPMSRAWNWCLGWSGIAALTWDPEMEFAAGEPQEEALTPDSSPPSTGASGEVRVPRWIVGGFAMLGVLQLAALLAGFLPIKEQWEYARRLNQQHIFRRSDLPATMGDWTQVDYRTEEHTRDAANFGESWTYRSAHGDALITVSYPFMGWHDLRGCYEGTGWQILATVEHPRGTAAEPLAPYLEAQMRGPDGDYGRLLFCLVDQAGRAVDLPGHVTWRRVVGKLSGNPLWNLLPEGSLPGHETTFQVQALVTSPDALSESHELALHRLFVAARGTLVSVYNQQRQVGHE